MNKAQELINELNGVSEKKTRYYNGGFDESKETNESLALADDRNDVVVFSTEEEAETISSSIKGRIERVDKGWIVAVDGLE